MGTCRWGGENWWGVKYGGGGGALGAAACRPPCSRRWPCGQVSDDCASSGWRLALGGAWQVLVGPGGAPAATHRPVDHVQPSSALHTGCHVIAPHRHGHVHAHLALPARQQHGGARAQRRWVHEGGGGLAGGGAAGARAAAPGPACAALRHHLGTNMRLMFSRFSVTEFMYTSLGCTGKGERREGQGVAGCAVAEGAPAPQGQPAAQGGMAAGHAAPCTRLGARQPRPQDAAPRRSPAPSRTPAAPPGVPPG